MFSSFYQEFSTRKLEEYLNPNNYTTVLSQKQILQWIYIVLAV